MNVESQVFVFSGLLILLSAVKLVPSDAAQSMAVYSSKKFFSQVGNTNAYSSPLTSSKT